MKKLTLLTLAGISLAMPAFAQTVPVNSNGDDLVLAFRIDDAAGQGQNSDLEVDLGQYTQFTTTSKVTLSELSPTDLSSTFGSNFDTRGDLVFSVVGNIASGKNPFFYATQSNATPQADASSSTYKTPSGQIASLLNILANSSPTANSTESAVIGNNSTTATSIANSYSNLSPTGGLQFGFFSTSATTTGVFDTEAVVNGVTTLNLYDFLPKSGGVAGSPVVNGVPSLLGTFTLSAVGNLSYAGANSGTPTIPEPSTYAMMLAAGGLLFFVLRLRKNEMID